jgi:hypothetical protein
MQNGREKFVEWEGKIGWASVIGLIQLLVFLLGGVFTVGQLINGNTNIKESVVELRNITTTLKDAQASNAERVGKMETSIIFLTTTVQQLERKIDQRR